MVLPQDVTMDDYSKALVGDVLGIARKLIAACRISGRRREEFFNISETEIALAVFTDL